MIEAAGHNSVVPISKYQGGWQPPAVYPPYVTNKQATYSHYLVVMPKNEVHGHLGQLHPGTLGVEKHMAEREQKSEIFQSQYPERYAGEANKEVHPTISGTMQNYIKNFPNFVSATCASWQG